MGLVPGLRGGVPYLRLELCSSTCVSPGGCPSSYLVWSCAFALGSSSQGQVCVGASTVGFSCVFLRDVVTLWVNSVFVSLLIANEGLHWWWFLSDVANPFWGRVVVFICPPSASRIFLWLVAALLPGLSLSFDSGLVFSWPHLLLSFESLGMLPCSPVVVRPPFVGPRVSLPSFLSFALQRALVVRVSPAGSRLVSSSIGTKVWFVPLSLLGCFFVLPLPFGIWSPYGSSVLVLDGLRASV